MTEFPERHWEITDYTPAGKPLWSSSENVDPYRRNLLRRILERDYDDEAECEALKQALVDWDLSVAPSE